MISCIICFANKELLKNVSESIEHTLGMPFEIIGIDNSDGKLSICEAYNKGADLAKFDILCFLHEDVLFETNNWGKILMDHFAELNNVGIVGVAGSSYKSLAPSGWWATPDKYLSYNFRQSYKHSKKETFLRTLNNDAVKEVISLDGVFLAVKKSVFEKYRFDNALPFFHGYDLDFSLAISAGFQNYFIPDIMLHHLSEGSIDDVWIENMFLLFKKWNKQLPLIITGDVDKKTESLIWQNYCRLVLASTIPLSKKLNILFHALWVISRRKKSFIPLYGLLRAVIYAAFKSENNK